jgi:hypothetical protein
MSPTDPCPPRRFAVLQSAIAVADRESAEPPAAAASARGDLLQLFASVSMGGLGEAGITRSRRGLALAAAVVLARMKGYTAIAGWVKDVPSAVLADLYMWAGASLARSVEGDDLAGGHRRRR